MRGRSNDEAEKAGQDASGRSAPERRRDQSSQTNPVWQSLALNPSGVQRKLSISRAGEPLEREADQIADRAVQAPESEKPLAGAATSSNASQVADLSGQSLDPSTRDLMESRLGQDFSRVKVHTDARADEAAAAVNARAFTSDGDIVFGSGEYQPATREGKRLIAHELGHVMQQARGEGSTGIQRTGTTPTENVAGKLWAEDDKGNVLPPNLEDVAQGGLGDCALMALLATIVNTNPDAIFKMITDNRNGTYTVTFKGIEGYFSTGQQTVSADFEVGKHSKVAGRSAFWPLIIEKAYAQEKGGTKAIEAAYPEAVLEDLMDVSATEFDPREETADYILGKVIKGKQEKWPMTIYSPKKEGAGKVKKELAGAVSGLYFDHTYAILDVDLAKKKIKLHNPWGFDHPNGDGWIDVEQVRTFFKGITIGG